VTGFQCDVFVCSFILREPTDFGVLLAEQVGLGGICGVHLAVVRQNDGRGLRRRRSAIDSSDDTPNLCRAQLPSAVRDELVPKTSFRFVNCVLGLTRSELKGLSLVVIVCSSCCCSCWGDLFKKPEAPSFQIGSGRSLAGLFFEQIVRTN